MSDNRDEHYQPWLQSAELPPVPALADGGIAKPRDSAPLGYDLGSSPTSLPKALPTERVGPSFADRARRFLLALRTGALRFADWTIATGDRADIPARIAALHLDDKLRRGASVTADAARTAAQAAGDAGAKARNDFAALKIGEKLADTGATLVANGREKLDQVVSTIRPAKPDDADVAPPPSGLAALLEREQAAPVAAVSTAPALPLFADMPSGTQTMAAPSAPRTAPSPATTQRHNAGGGNGGGDHNGGWWRDRTLWIGFAIGASLAALALAYVAGQRSGGVDKAEVETIVHDYILANPQIIPQAMERLQGQQNSAAITALRPQIETPFAGAWAGNAKGDVTLVVFSDFACGFCRQSVGDIDRLLKNDPNVKIIFRELPILSEASVEAARAGLTAAAQGKYMAFHTAMFANSPPTTASIAAASAKAGLTSGEGATVPTRATMDRELQANLAAAQKLGFQGTPAWVVGDRTLNGAVGYDEMKRAVDAARAGK